MNVLIFSFSYSSSLSIRCVFVGEIIIIQQAIAIAIVVKAHTIKRVLL